MMQNFKMNIGYIYIRTNEYWDLYDSFKLGKTLSIPDREQTYITSEIKRGTYVMIIEIDLIILDNVEKQLQIYFNKLNLHIKFNAGIEFYKKEIINFIIPYFDKNNIKYKILSKDEIDGLIRKIRIYDNNDNDNTSDGESVEYIEKQIENVELNNKIYNPRDYQEIIINKSYEYFQINEKGLLIIPCGVGKTLISLWITQELNSNTILIGVPNKLLLKQWEEVICVLFQNIPYLIVSGGVDIENIMQFLENNQKKCIVITTYSSAHKVYTATQYTRFVFGMKLLDEVHHLTTNNMRLVHTTKKYIQMLNIPSVKQLSLTATLKQLESMCDDGIVVSNDNVEYFGEIIDRKCLLWAINENIICDYVIQTIITNEEQLEQQLSRFHIIEENDKRLFLSAFASLKSIFDGHSHHLLIYSNNKDNSLKLIQYIKMLLDNNYFDIPDLYYSNYHSEMKSKDQKEIINNFEKAKFGIITCVYCLGEGYDNHNIDAVVFAENMSSNIRIVQSALRASRKNKHQPNKITKIILPILNKDDWLDNNNNPDLKKVREVIYQMGLEDKTITQKIKVFNIEVKKHTISISKKYIDDVDNFGDYDEELTTKLRLKTIKRTTLGTSYEKARKIIVSKNIKNKEEYFELCEKDNRLSVEPELTYNGQFTNWIEYLSIERIYYDLETCIEKVNELLILHNEIKKHYLDLSIVCKELCELDNNFPPNGLWVEYYNVKDLRDIIIIVNKKKKMGAII
jgi:superfamily II DNA or RNA helicase